MPKGNSNKPRVNIDFINKEEQREIREERMKKAYVREDGVTICPPLYAEGFGFDMGRR